MRRELVRREAHRLIDLGYALVPLRYGEKTPLIKWRELESNHDSADRWFSQFGVINLAIQTGRSGIVGLDADSCEAEAWINRHCPLSPMVARTPRGGLHAYYRATADAPSPKVNVLGIGLDVRAGRSILVVPPSWNSERKAPWLWRGPILSPSGLPEFPASILPVRPVPRPTVPSGQRHTSGRIRDVARWIMRVESIEGQNGSGNCYRVACRLADAGMSWDEAWSAFAAWNAQCAKPPWSEKELNHKLIDAFKRFG